MTRVQEALDVSKYGRAGFGEEPRKAGRPAEAVLRLLRGEDIGEVSREVRFYRRRRPKTGQRQPRPAPARALGEAERTEVFRVLCSPRFTDRAPAEVCATLLDEGVYLCSERTMYRILAENRAVQRGRNWSGGVGCSWTVASRG